MSKWSFGRAFLYVIIFSNRKPPPPAASVQICTWSPVEALWAAAESLFPGFVRGVVVVVLLALSLLDPPLFSLFSRKPATTLLSYAHAYKHGYGGEQGDNLRQFSPFIMVRSGISKCTLPLLPWSCQTNHLPINILCASRGRPTTDRNLYCEFIGISGKIYLRVRCKPPCIITFRRRRRRSVRKSRPSLCIRNTLAELSFFLSWLVKSGKAVRCCRVCKQQATNTHTNTVYIPLQEIDTKIKILHRHTHSDTHIHTHTDKQTLTQRQE